MRIRSGSSNLQSRHSSIISLHGSVVGLHGSHCELQELQSESPQLRACHFYADPDPASDISSDPYQTFHFDQFDVDLNPASHNYMRF
jgi:hypothetical protein